MTIVYKYFIRPLLFLLPAERAHYFTFSLIKFGFRLPGVMRLVEKYYYVKSPEKKVFGLKFPSPIGLAAGFDKNAKVIDEMASLGFGFVEIGTVTPLPQVGNPKPRLFRLKKDQGIINRMGFNNDGMEAIAERLKKKKKNIIIGGNIGKNKVTPNEEAKDDYLKAFRALFGYVDYFVVNVSSPNTPNLRALQEKEPLMELLQALQEKNQTYPCPKPILLKIAPDLNESQLDEIIEVVLETKLDGVIATNTTISREGLKTSSAKIEKIGNGGLSGNPIRDRSTAVIRYLHQKSQGAFAIVGVGGIHRPEDAIEKLKAGASLVQVYTGFVYEGPGLIKKIKQQAKDLRMAVQK